MSRFASISSRSRGLFTKRTNNRQAIETLCATLQALMARQDLSLQQVVKVAVSFAGPIDLCSGHILKAYNLGGARHQGDLAGPLWDHLTGHYGTPTSLRVYVMNDALAPALAILCLFTHTGIRPNPFIVIPSHAKLPALCISLGTSLGVSAIAARSTASDGEEHGLITLPETWVCATVPTADGPTCLWELLGAKANSLDPQGVEKRILSRDGALLKLLELWAGEASLVDPPNTVIFTGGFASSLTHLDGTSWNRPQSSVAHDVSMVLVVPNDPAALTLQGAMNFRASPCGSPLVCRVRRVAVIEGLETTGLEVVLRP